MAAQEQLFKTLPVFFSELFNGGRDDQGVFKCIQYYAWLGEAINPDELWSAKRSALSRDARKIKEIKGELVNGWDLRLPQKSRYFPGVIPATSDKPCAMATFFEWLRSKVQSGSSPAIAERSTWRIGLGKLCVLAAAVRG